MANAFNINTDEVVVLTQKLEQLHRSAMPVAVRQSLNRAAFNMKTKGVSEMAGRKFIIRRPTFIKSHIGYNKSPNTFDINKMVSEVGIIQGKSRSGDQLEKQEFGGRISDRNVPTIHVRIGEQLKNKITGKYYYKKFQSVTSGHLSRNRQRTIIKGRNGSIYQVKKGGEWQTLYTQPKNVQIKERKFIKPAGELEMKHIPKYFLEFGEKKIKQIMSKS